MIHDCAWCQQDDADDAPTEAEMYEEWAREQPEGADTGPEAWRDACDAEFDPLPF